MAARVMARAEREAPGFTAEIPQAFWRRVTRYHLPVKWFGCWLAVVIVESIFAFTHLRASWQLILGGCVFLAMGQLMAMQWLTWADPQWDALLLRRDCRYYEAE